MRTEFLISKEIAFLVPFYKGYVKALLLGYHHWFKILKEASSSR